MFRKAEVFGDFEVADEVLQTRTPKDAKALGRRVRGFDNEIWLQHRWDIVVKGSVEKFSQNPSLKAFLLGTGDSVLVEASPVDSIWGIGMRKSEAIYVSPEAWKGENLLGFALMEARQRIMEDAV